jgi:16S rRNA U516 pseudouridylate synthase RsuA-like enzyme
MTQRKVKTRRMNITISEAQYKAIERQSARTGAPISKIVRLAIADFTGIEDAVTIGGDRVSEDARAS